jgi:TPR repeat protein
VIGAMYYTGNAVPQDQKLAVHLVPQGGRAGPPDAQHALGLMYRYHVAGMPQDR